MFGKLSTLCFIPLPFFFAFFPRHSSELEMALELFFHIRFHAWLSTALIYQTWNFAFLKLNKTVEVSVLHFGMFSTRVPTLCTVLLEAKYSTRWYGIRICYWQRLVVFMQEEFIDPGPVSPVTEQELHNLAWLMYPKHDVINLFVLQINSWAKDILCICESRKCKSTFKCNDYCYFLIKKNFLVQSASSFTIIGI